MSTLLSDPPSSETMDAASSEGVIARVVMFVVMSRFTKPIEGTAGDTRQSAGLIVIYCEQDLTPSSGWLVLERDQLLTDRHLAGLQLRAVLKAAPGNA